MPLTRLLCPDAADGGDVDRDIDRSADPRGTKPRVFRHGRDVSNKTRSTGADPDAARSFGRGGAPPAPAEPGQTNVRGPADD